VEEEGGKVRWGSDADSCVYVGLVWSISYGIVCIIVGGKRRKERNMSDDT